MSLEIVPMYLLLMAINKMSFEMKVLQKKVEKKFDTKSRFEPIKVKSDVD